MRYLGVDLAWGERARTGLAALDESGRLVASTTAVTDDDVVAFAQAHAPGAVVAAVDAPLVVPNERHEQGQRDCERELAALFGRYHAGPHPSNRGNPAFVPEPRGARLARRLGWSLDPRVRPGTGTRTCVEVYPHPAMVSLFGLPRVLPYKQKPGRDLPALLAAWAQLLHHVETTAGGLLQLGASARWQQLRAAATTATRKSELRRLEDEVDAVFCAYLAWLWTHEPDRMLVLGDVERGYVVTPPPPPAPPPPSPPPATPDAARASTSRDMRSRSLPGS